MALDLKLKLTISGDCKVFIIKDVTGDYDSSTNPGGYGSPNPAKTDFNGSADYWNLRIINPLGVSSTIQYPGNNPQFSTSLLFTNGLGIFNGTTGSLTDQISLSAGTSLLDGQYAIYYTLYDSGLDITYSTSKQYFITCTLDCIMKKKLLELAEDACINCCDEKKIDAYMEYTIYHKALQDSVKCGDIKAAKNLYKLLAKKLNFDCGCGCN